jgi:hypothetical protein
VYWLKGRLETLFIRRVRGRKVGERRCGTSGDFNKQLGHRRPVVAMGAHPLSWVRDVPAWWYNPEESVKRSGAYPVRGFKRQSLSDVPLNRSRGPHQDHDDHDPTSTEVPCAPNDSMPTHSCTPLSVPFPFKPGDESDGALTGFYAYAVGIV